MCGVVYFFPEDPHLIQYIEHSRKYKMVFSLCFIFVPFQWLLYRSGDKGGKYFLPLSGGPVRDQAKSQLCPPVRAKRGGHDSAFSSFSSASAAGLHLPQTAFRRHSYSIPSSSQRKLLCSSSRCMPVHKPFQRLCQNSPTTL